MEPDEIRDFAGLADWLEARPIKTRASEAACISARIAARVFPIIYAHRRVSDTFEKVSFLNLQVMRCLLITNLTATLSVADQLAQARNLASGAARISSLGDRYAAMAARAADTAVHSSTPRDSALVAEYAVNAIEGSAGPTEEILGPVRNDVRLLDLGNDPLMSPLWPDLMPDWFKLAKASLREEWENFESFLEDDDGNRLVSDEDEFLLGDDDGDPPLTKPIWSFWTRW